MKFNKQGIVTMVLGRKDEAIDYIERSRRGQHKEGQAPNGAPDGKQLRSSYRRDLGYAR